MNYIIKVSGFGAGEKIFTKTAKEKKLAEGLLNRKSKSRQWYADDEDIPVTATIAKSLVDKELSSLKEQMAAFEKEKEAFAKMKAESQGRAAEIESKAKITKTEADSKANIMQAEADAKVKLIAAQAEADRIRIINSALTPNYLRLQEIENFTYKTELVTPQGVYKISQKEQ